MGRPTRSFKLRVSPDGFDLIVDCHVRLVRRTRTLLPYGTVLNVAIHYLAALDVQQIAEAVSRFPRVELMSGSQCKTLFVGAPRSMMEIANEIALRLAAVMPAWQIPQRSELYLLSLHEFLEAEGDALVSTYMKIKEQEPMAGDSHPC